MRFDLTDLRIFLSVVEAGSITAGAVRSHLSLASASARIRGLETRLGTPLLERTRRGAVPTAAGLALAHHARLMERQLDHLSAELGEFARGLKGRVRLLCNTAALSEFLPQALGDFLAAHPSIDVEAEERSSAAIVAALAEGLADLGIVSDAVDTGDLATTPIHDDRLVLVAPLGHALLAAAAEPAGGESPSLAPTEMPDSAPAALLSPLPFAATLAWDFVGLAGASALQDYLADHARRAGQHLCYRVRVSGFDAICRLVAARVGVAVVPESAARRHAGTLGWRPLGDAWASRRLLLCRRRDAALPAYAARLAEALAGRPPA